MDQATIEAVIADLRMNVLAEGIHLNGIALFGSAMRGDMHEDSDIDLILISEDFENKNIFERTELVSHLPKITLRKFMIPMDILLKTPEEYARGMMFETRLIA